MKAGRRGEEEKGGKSPRLAFLLYEGIPLKPITPSAVADEALVQTTAALADPADTAGRNAGH
jgi:hypothetical protein